MTSRVSSKDSRSSTLMTTAAGWPCLVITTRPCSRSRRSTTSESRFFTSAVHPLSGGQGNPPSGWGNPYQPGTMTLLSPATAVFRDQAGHQVRFRLRRGATKFGHVCSLGQNSGEASPAENVTPQGLPAPHPRRSSSAVRASADDASNGLLRQYLPKGTDLSVHSAEDLARIAASPNNRPRRTLGFMKPSGKLAEILALTA